MEKDSKKRIEETKKKINYEFREAINQHPALWYDELGMSRWINEEDKESAEDIRTKNRIISFEFSFGPNNISLTDIGYIETQNYKVAVVRANYALHRYDYTGDAAVNQWKLIGSYNYILYSNKSSPTYSHFKEIQGIPAYSPGSKCDLEHRVLDVAENKWNKLELYQTIDKFYEHYSINPRNKILTEAKFLKLREIVPDKIEILWSDRDGAEYEQSRRIVNLSDEGYHPWGMAYLHNQEEFWDNKDAEFKVH